MGQHYPAMVVQNHRHRGPMESKKDNEFIEDAFGAITHLRELFSNNQKNINGIAADINKLNNEDGDVHKSLHRMEERLLALKGGELQ